MSTIKRLNKNDPGFDQALADLLAWESVSDDAVLGLSLIHISEPTRL